MTTVLFLFLVIPFVLAGLTVTDSIRSVMRQLDVDGQREAERLDSLGQMEKVQPVLNGQAKTTLFDPNVQTAKQQSDPNAQAGLPPPPKWLGHVPWVGGKISQYWLQLKENAGPMLNSLRPSLEATIVIAMTRAAVMCRRPVKRCTKPNGNNRPLSLRRIWL
jgi:hypothetical protein